MKIKMNSRERVIKTYNFELPDKIPVDFCADTPVYDALIARVGVKDQLSLMEYFNIDFRWARPGWVGPMLKTSNGRITDYFGIPREGVDFGYATTRPLADVKTTREVEDYINNKNNLWPRAEYYDFEVFLEEAKRFRDEGYAVYGGQWGWFFSAACDLVGMDKFFIMMFDLPEVAFKIMEMLSDTFMECNEIMFHKAKGYIDIYFTGDDYGQQCGPLVSPELWRKLIKPHAKKLFNHAKKFNLFIDQHSCGSITYILDDLIEIGLNSIEPVQVRAHDMEFKSLVDRYAGRVVLHGSIDTQQTLTFGSTEDVRKEVISRIELFKNKGGFILAPSQHFLTDIPLENILTMYKTAEEFRNLQG